MDPTTDMAELWGTLYLAGNMKSSGCDFMSLKQSLPDSLGPGCEGLYLRCLQEEFGLQLHGAGAVLLEKSLVCSSVNLEQFLLAMWRPWPQSEEEFHLQCLHVEEFGLVVQCTIVHVNAAQSNILIAHLSSTCMIARKVFNRNRIYGSLVCYSQDKVIFGDRSRFLSIANSTGPCYCEKKCI